MGFFGRKKKGSDAEGAVEKEAPKKGKEKKEKPPKKKAPAMAQIFHESVVETAIDLFKQNESFIHVENDVNKYVGMVLDTADIGGLDKKSRKDEAKGSLIECINSGRIATYISWDLMEVECICIIPTFGTLAAMDDFNMLTEAPYELCLVDEDGGLELLGIKTTYEQIATLQANDGHIDNLLGDLAPSSEPRRTIANSNNVSGGSVDGLDDDPDEVDDTVGDAPAKPGVSMGGADPDDVPAAADDDEIVDAQAEEDEIPDIDGAPAQQAGTEVPPAAPPPGGVPPVPPPGAPIQDPGAGGNDFLASMGGMAGDPYAAAAGDPYAAAAGDPYADASGDPYASAMEDPYAAAMTAEKMPEQEIPEDYTLQTVIRKFYSDDLGLEVTSEPFDAQFMQSNPYVPFNESRAPGWINDQLNEMSRAANVELARLHSTNLWQMRERYFKLVAYACERIRNDLDVHDEGTQYGQIYRSIEADKESSLAGLDKLVMRKKNALNDAWKKRLQEIGIDAARAAQRQYVERYGRQHDAEVARVESVERAAAEDDYQDKLHEMQKRRRVEAASLLDLEITEILGEISDLYMTSLTEERDRYKELEEEMRRFVDDHRQEDIARSAALAEELRQSEKADRVLAEQVARQQSMAEEYRQHREALLAQIDDLKRQNAESIGLLKDRHAQDLVDAENRRKELEGRYDDLLMKYQNLDREKEKEFQARFSEMKDLNEALEDRADHLMEVHRRSNLVSTFLFIAVAIAALAIGFIGGQYMNMSQRTALERERAMLTSSLQSAQDNTQQSSQDGNQEPVQDED